ncbi:hypothetical protein [Clostridium sp. 'deep sea']|nr:hypothetical protein [Clostridium sp. 'deep sea']
MLSNILKDGDSVAIIKGLKDRLIMRPQKSSKGKKYSPSRPRP